MNALTEINAITAMPAITHEIDCPLYDEVSEQEVTLKCGFVITSERVSDDAVNGGAFYTEYTARLVSARVGRLVVDRDTFSAMLGHACLADAEETACGEVEVA